ncbi:MAG: M3 family oligoendopeptidase [Alphaproteobacteria bacterium]|nr:MAG: M3 family oligoendopeptidase [Alphaproteobacteria bacterium]
MTDPEFARQAEASGAEPARGDAAGPPLPEWDLTDLYPGTESAALKRDLTSAQDRTKAFKHRYHGKVAGLDGDALGEAVAEYEDIDETLSRLMSYAQLIYAGNISDPEVAGFYQTLQERVTEISTDLVFFTLEINLIEDGEIADKLKAERLNRYAPWIRDVRVLRPHQLDEDLEKILREKAVSGRSAWVRLFDETMARLRFPVDGKDLTSAEVLHLLSDSDAKVREAAALSLGKVLSENAPVFALITNTLAKDKEIEDRWRKFPRPTSFRNLSNLVEDEVVDALISAVKGAYPKLSHRYYALKARWFGVERLRYWDRNAPLPEDDDRQTPWDEARDKVLGAYGAFAPEMEATARKFFDRRWIDAGVRSGKDPGAFSHPTVPSAHPYILLNYQGKTRDVMTLAHELGHGVHQVLAAPRGHLLADTPLTLAETASVFGEMLTFRALLADETDVPRRRVMLAGKIEDMLNTVVRQTAFYDFELKVHGERKKGEVPAERLCEIWLEVQRESLGPAIDLEGDYRFYWIYIPHFIHSPFYVYAYAFGDCLVNSLYATYREWEGAADLKGTFKDKYLDMLKAGGTKRHRELLAPFGLDATDPAFWDRGLGMISSLIEELEELD